ncbi:MAG: hypothetical protein V3V84_07700 [Candidatus Bathyarchaeia archaeon]
MIERTDNEDDHDPKPEYTACECGAEFESHEGVKSDYLSHHEDEDVLFCSDDCRIDNEFYRRTEQSFNHQYTTEVAGIKYTVTHTSEESNFRVDEIEILDDNKRFLNIYFPENVTFDKDHEAVIRDYILTGSPDHKCAGMHGESE